MTRRRSKREIEAAVEALGGDDEDRVRAWFEEFLSDGWNFTDADKDDSDAVTVVHGDTGEWRVSRDDLPEFIDEADLPVSLGVSA